MKILKIGLALLLFFCLANMPYGYYQLVRFVSFIVFVVFAIDATQKEKETDVIIYAILALLFQPFLKISLGRDLWNIVDVIVGLFLLASLSEKKNDK
jgi:hypothetical protein